MAGWTIKGRGFRYEGGADPSADVSHGFRFTIDRDGEQRSVNVEAARGAPGMSEASARSAVYQHLTDEPPHRIVMGSDGDFYPVTD
jgi:hypothetical protein